MSIKLQNLECGAEQTLVGQPSGAHHRLEEQELEWLNSLRLEDDSPVQSYVEEQQLECSNSLCLVDVVDSPVHPPYSPLPTTSQEESDCVNTTYGDVTWSFSRKCLENMLLSTFLINILQKCTNHRIS